MRALAFLCLLLFGPLASTTAEVGIVGAKRAEVAREAVTGRWEAYVGALALPLRFYEDGTFALDDRTGTFSIDGNELSLREGEGEPVTYAFDLQDHYLVLRGGDLAQELRFAKAPGGDDALQGYFRWLFDVSWLTASERFYRVLTILGIAVLAVVFVNLLRVISSFLIFSEVGPFRYFYRKHKTKTKTIHSVVLNILKYIIYFTALGHIFADLGINYATYFASLSVIGLAVGFGSQGLVQDIVTGFFLIFDGQFGVGDMVEISGQTGVVEELGLRTTRIRNYMGQIVVIPNRNIALVGNYSKGAVRAYIDVAIPDETPVAKAADTLRTVCREIRRQFDGTVLQDPKDMGTLRLATGETFRRISMDLWPQQHQQLVDTQILPRIREAFAREELEIPNNRIAVTYRLPEPGIMIPWRKRFTRQKKPNAPATSDNA